ncbi:N-6 DNA methylase [Salmonella enterica]|nr:N-6 DNA methylase [Salmonella enterica]
MSQLSFVDVFNMARESAGSKNSIQNAQPGSEWYPASRRVMSAQYSRNRFISVFKSTGRHLRRWEVFSDFLSLVASELGDNWRGQYFTPYSVQSLMARMLIPGIQETIRREGIVTVSDPASGAAGMLIAYAECLLEADINPSMHMFGSCIDIDPVAADMAFIQLSLLGIAAEVVTGNTLTMQFNRVRYTPVYYLNGFEKRLADLRRFRAMRDFMRGLSDAA